MPENEDTQKLADRLSDRKGSKRRGSEPRLGNRFVRRLKEEAQRRGGEKILPGTEGSPEFFELYEELSKEYPDLKDIKVSELKNVISKIGMKHPEEIIATLQKDNFKTEIQKKRDKYITY